VPGGGLTTRVHRARELLESRCASETPSLIMARGVLCVLVWMMNSPQNAI
jgi:hypothetical protein